MLLPVTQRPEAGGAAGASAKHLAELIVAAVPAGTADLADRRLKQKSDAEAAGPAVEIAPSASAGPVEPSQALSHRIARWEPVARALGHATQAVVGFLKSVGVPQAEAEDMARRAAEAARERLVIDPAATQAHFDAGRLSLKLEDVRIGLRRGAGKGEVSIGKAEIAIDVVLPGARKDESGASLGGAEAEIGQRKAAFTYAGPGATPAYADRGAAAVSFSVASPLAPATPGPAPSPGPVDVAI